MTDQDAARTLYATDSTIAHQLDVNQTALEDRLGLSPEEQAAERESFLSMMRESKLDLDTSTALLLHNTWTAARLAASRTPDDEAPDVPALADLNEATWQELRLRYGPDLQPLMLRTRRFVKSHPLLNEILSTGSIGSREDVTMAVVEHVRRHTLGRNATWTGKNLDPPADWTRGTF